MEQKTNPVKAIREFCIDCCGGSRETVKNCPSVRCSLYPFRLGKNPFKQKRELTEEQRNAIRDRLKKGRENKENIDKNDL